MPPDSGSEGPAYASSMATDVRIPEFLRGAVDGADVLEAEGTRVRDLIADLDARHPGFGDRLLDDSGLRRYINVYVGRRDIRFADGLDTAVAAGDTVLILPASSGGMFLP